MASATFSHPQKQITLIRVALTSHGSLLAWPCPSLHPHSVCGLTVGSRRCSRGYIVSWVQNLEVGLREPGIRARGTPVVGRILVLLSFSPSPVRRHPRRPPLSVSHPSRPLTPYVETMPATRPSSSKPRRSKASNPPVSHLLPFTSIGPHRHHPQSTFRPPASNSSKSRPGATKRVACLAWWCGSTFTRRADMMKHVGSEHFGK